MNRRAFLATLSGSALGLTLDPERLVWVPGQKTIFLPTPDRIVTPIALRRGDLFTIEGWLAMDPLTGRPTTILQRFVVTDDCPRGEIPPALLCPPPRRSGLYQVIHEPVPTRTHHVQVGGPPIQKA